MLPSAMAENNIQENPLTVVAADDDDDDFDKDDDDDDEVRLVGISRPEVICRNVTKNSAELIIKVRVRNKTDRDISGVVSLEIENNEGDDVAKVNDKIQIPAGRTVLSKSVVTLRKPHLFSADRTYRDKVEAEVLDRRGEEISEDKSSKFVVGNGMGSIRKNNARVLDRRNHADKNKSELRLQKADLDD